MPGYPHNTVIYPFGVFDFGAGNEEFSFKGPKGKKGRLIDYGYLSPTETFAGSSSLATIAIGNASDPDHYGEEFGSGTLADKAGMLSILSAYSDPADIDDYILNYGELPADTSIYVTCTGCVGGPAGMAIPFAAVQWAD